MQSSHRAALLQDQGYVQVLLLPRPGFKPLFCAMELLYRVYPNHEGSPKLEERLRAKQANHVTCRSWITTSAN